MNSLLSVENLDVRFETTNGTVTAVDGVSLSIDRGEIFGLVGESGSGKSVTARAIMGLESPGRVTGGTITYNGIELTTLANSERRQYRGNELAMVFQDPSTTLNPVFDVGEQIAESLRLHDVQADQSLLDFFHVRPFADHAAWASHRTTAIELMKQVGIASADERVDAYPHELSGGMCQRVMIAIALAADPELLIVDEPMTALDTTTKARILDRLRTLAVETDTAILVISHDVGVVDDLCDRVAVMYGGQVMEAGPTEQVIHSPEHPYTKGLVDCRVTADSCYPLPTIPGMVPDQLPDTGCPFASRCVHATDACRSDDPPTVRVGANHRVSCGELHAVRTAGGTGDSDTEQPPSQQHSNVPEALLEVDGGSPRRRKPATERTNRSTNVATEDTSADSEPPLLEARNVTKQFDLSASALDRWIGARRTLTAVDDVDLAVTRGATAGIVGKSGSGKSTLMNILTGLCEPTTGQVYLNGDAVEGLTARSTDQLREVGVVFQNPQDSINPRLTVRRAIAEPMIEDGWPREKQDARVNELLDFVGLSEKYGSRRPHQLSGGQLQRIAIARAITLEPQVVVLDEPVSALDLSTQAKILNLLVDIQRRLGLTYLVISHDLDAVRLVADQVAVMYDGRIVESGSPDTVFRNPTHHHTIDLVEASTIDHR